MKQQVGFTLIELIVVIVILGILSAVAIPKFVSLESNARTASMQGVNGAVRSASTLVHALALVNNQTGATGTVTVEGTTINTVFGYPATADIDDALDISDFTFTAGTFTITGYTPASGACEVVYTQPASANARPTITLTTTGC